MALLHNRVNKEVLKQELEQEDFKRRTLSFYQYFEVENPQEFRDQLYKKWFALQCFGRIYVAREGINAQMSVPEHNFEQFMDLLYAIPELHQVPIKYAIEDDGKSFFKLTIKVRPKIVADGLEHGTYDLSKVGKHLSALEFHEAIDNQMAIVVDMRNHYESEIGRFKNAWCPDVDTFREEVTMVVNELKDKKNQKILLYCTGGVRCEKASAYMRHHGFEDVNQLHGGIIAYAEEIKKQGIASNFIGKNFVFDERMGEAVTDDVLAKCHQCGAPCDSHINCANDDCHLLFIQCEACAEKYDKCCSDECKEVLSLPEAERNVFRDKFREKYAGSQIFKSRLRPKLNCGCE
jgi:UPF0176 protein